MTAGLRTLSFWPEAEPANTSFRLSRLALDDHLRNVERSPDRFPPDTPDVRTACAETKPGERWHFFEDASNDGTYHLRTETLTAILFLQNLHCKDVELVAVPLVVSFPRRYSTTRPGLPFPSSALQQRIVIKSR
jgi:hypothetical protein